MKLPFDISGKRGNGQVSNKILKGQVRTAKSGRSSQKTGRWRVNNESGRSYQVTWTPPPRKEEGKRGFVNMKNSSNLNKNWIELTLPTHITVNMGLCTGIANLVIGKIKMFLLLGFIYVYKVSLLGL